MYIIKLDVFFPQVHSYQATKSIIITRAYVNRRGARRKGVNMDVILSSMSLMAASLLALVRGIAISIIINPQHACAEGYSSR